MTRTIALVNTCMTVIAQARKPHGDYCAQNDAICTSGSSKQIERDAERRQDDDRAPCNLYAESNCMSSQIGIPRGPPIRQLVRYTLRGPKSYKRKGRKEGKVVCQCAAPLWTIRCKLHNERKMEKHPASLEAETAKLGVGSAVRPSVRRGITVGIHQDCPVLSRS